MRGARGLMEERVETSRVETLTAAAIAVAAAVLFAGPVLKGWERWGIGDWDQHQFFYGVARWAIAETRQLPLWNPFACGGGPLLADPQSPALYPLFAVVLVAGVVPGIKALILIHAAISIFGAWLLARRIGCGPIASWIPAAAWGMSSAYALHLAAGHATWLAMAWVPLAFTGLHAGFTRPVAAIAGGAAAAMILLAGNVYLFAYAALFGGTWALLASAERRSGAPLAAFGLMNLSALGLAAVKILPMIHSVRSAPPAAVFDGPAASPLLIGLALAGREQGLEAHHALGAGQFWRWWEYGSYVGTPVLALAAAFVFLRPRRAWSLAVPALVALLVSLGRGWGAWDLLRPLPVFATLRVPSRAIVFAALFIGLMAGRMVTQWELRWGLGPVALAVAVIALDIGWVGRAALGDAFVVEPQTPERAPFRQTIGRIDFGASRDPGAGRRAAYTDQYPALLANRGTINCYNRFHLAVRAQPAELPGGVPNPSYRGEAWITSGGEARLASIGGRRLVVEIAPRADGILVVNQNFAAGWRASDRRPVRDHAGLLSAPVSASDRSVVFIYAPPRLLPGAALTLFSILAIAAAPSVARRRGAA